MSQFNLFGDEPEPETYPQAAGFKEQTTSKDAAESTDAEGLRAEVLSCLASDGPMTADECAHMLQRSVLAIRPRFSELRAVGRVEPTGVKRENQSGKAAMEWRLT